MTGNEYQALAMRTNDGKSTDRVISGVLTRDLKWLHNQNVVREDTEGLDLGGVLNGCLGLAGESGEVLDMVKKCVFHEKKMDKYHLKKELGDVMWYVAMLCESFGFDLDEILQMNVDKLKARYPEGFDPEKANNRKPGDV
jgi:NTP pyrophosphatase (non-canonical NTP hydrolase)